MSPAIERVLRPRLARRQLQSGWNRGIPPSLDYVIQDRGFFDFDQEVRK